MSTIKMIDLPVPLPSVQPRGLPSTDPNFNPTVVKSFRITEEDYEKIEAAAKITGTTCSEFVRWCAHYAAVDLLRKHRKRKA